MEQLRIAQYLNSNSKTKGKECELLKKVDVNYCVSDALPGKQQIRKRWAGYTSLHFAIMKRDLNLINELLARGANLFKQSTANGCTPLHIAMNDISVEKMFGRLQEHRLITTLLSKQVEINNTLNPKCKNGVSHLHMACIVNHAEAVEFFVKAKECLDQSTNSDARWIPGYTPLHCAIEYSSVESAEILLRHGADVHVKNTKGMSCVDLLVERIMDMKDFITMGKRRLCMPYEKEIEYLESIIKSMLEARRKDEKCLDDDIGLSAFHLACTLREKSVVEKLLNKDVDVNMSVNTESKSWPGWTPLHFAACISIDMMILLMQRGDDITMKNAKGETAVDLCAKRFTPVDIQLILSMDKQIKNTVMSDNYTKLSDLLLVMNDCDKLSDFLQNLKNVNIVIPSSSPIWPGYNLLHLCLSLNDRAKCSQYSDKRLDVPDDLPERYNCTEDEEALYGKRIELCLKFGCGVSIRNANGQTPIHLAFSAHRESAMLQKLLDCSEDNVVDTNGLSHLHVACAWGHLAAVERYVSEGVDVNCRVKIGFGWHDKDVRANSTPLHVAVVFRHEKIVDYLLEHNADVYAEDSLGLTPIHLEMSLFRQIIEPRIAKRLFKATPSLRDSVSKVGLSHLHVAAWADDREAVDRLLLNGAEVDRVIDADVKEQFPFLTRFAGETPLLVARYSNKAAKRLLKAGADALAKDAEGVSALQYVLRDMSVEPITHFVRAVKRGKFGVESCGTTLLHVACGDCNVDWAEELLEKGADVNARISDEGHSLLGATPLHLLLEEAGLVGCNELADFVELLVDHGADVTLESCEGKTPLHRIYEYVYVHGYYEDSADGCKNSIFSKDSLA